MFLPSYVLHAIGAIEASGKEAYVVGGCVRDALRGTTPHDYDLTTSATPAEMQAIFASYRTIETGLKHGTLTVMIAGKPLEITTYRIDGSYADGRHPDQVAFTTDLAADLARRDFTVNAMAYHPDRGLVDLFGGREDLAARTIRAVGDPVTRFTEDGLRILRALRFAATLDFSIEPATAAAIVKTDHLLKQIAVERITTEFSALLCGKRAGAYLSAFSHTVSVFLPHFHAFSSENATVLQQTPPILAVRLAVLFSLCGCGEKAEEILRAMRYPVATIRTIAKLCALAKEPIETTKQAVRFLLRGCEPETCHMLLEVQVALGVCTAQNATSLRALLAEVLEAGECYSIGGLAIGGADLKALGVPPGKGMGALLEEILSLVITEQLPNTKEALCAFVKTQN